MPTIKFFRKEASAVRRVTGWVNSVAATPDGSRAVSASYDGTVRLWDLESRKEIAVFTGEDAIRNCVVAPDEQTIVAGEQSRRVHFLRLVEADKTKPSIGDTKIQILRRKERASPPSDS